MSTNELKLVGCSGKVYHHSKEKAQRHLARLRHCRVGYVGHIYRCSECFGWHVGRKPKEIRKAMRKEDELQCVQQKMTM